MMCHLAKIFAALYALVSVGVVLSARVFVIGPLLGTPIKVGFEYVERRKGKIESKIKKNAGQGEDEIDD